MLVHNDKGKRNKKQRGKLRCCWLIWKMNNEMWICSIISSSSSSTLASFPMNTLMNAHYRWVEWRDCKGETTRRHKRSWIQANCVDSDWRCKVKCHHGHPPSRLGWWWYIPQGRSFRICIGIYIIERCTLLTYKLLYQSPKSFDRSRACIMSALLLV